MPTIANVQRIHDIPKFQKSTLACSKALDLLSLPYRYKYLFLPIRCSIFATIGVFAYICHLK